MSGIHESSNTDDFYEFMVTYEEYKKGLSVFREARSHMFSTYHKEVRKESEDPRVAAESRLRSHDLTSKQKEGLVCELRFYHCYRGEYSLMVGADVGDQTDFGAIINDQAVRIDVTTNPVIKMPRLGKYDNPDVPHAIAWPRTMDGCDFGGSTTELEEFGIEWIGRSDRPFTHFCTIRVRIRVNIP